VDDSLAQRLMQFLSQQRTTAPVPVNQNGMPMVAPPRPHLPVNGAPIHNQMPGGRIHPNLLGNVRG
jgi:hypothetical protein